MRGIMIFSIRYTEEGKKQENGNTAGKEKTEVYATERIQTEQQKEETNKVSHLSGKNSSSVEKSAGYCGEIGAIGGEIGGGDLVVEET